MWSCILCVHIETSSLWAEFVNKNRCISVRLVFEEVKSIKFDNFDNSHNSFLWPEYFIDFFMWKMDPMSGCNIRLVFTLPPSDSTLQYKRCVHFWNTFPCITSLEQTEITEHVFAFFLFVNENVIIAWIKVLIADFPFYRKRDNKMHLTVSLNEKITILE